MNNHFITGFMGTGKTAVGRELAKRVGRRFIDTDSEIERTAGMSISAIFRDRGESEFRALERQAIQTACEAEGAVVATGGGAVLDPVNRTRMRGAGRIVCLGATAERILDRVGPAESRPLLEGAPHPLERIRELLAERASAYACADFHVETSSLTPAQIVERIVEWLNG